jgi:hypothetical protein
MAEQFGIYKVFNSNSSKTQRANVTVRRMDDGAVVARVYSEHSKPLARIRKWPKCSERLELVNSLLENKVPSDVIMQIVSMKGK